MNIFVVIFSIVLFVLSFGVSPANSSEIKKYLFIGNSFTFVNKLPTMFAGLANARGFLTDVSFVGIGAASFQSLFKNPDFATHVYKTDEKWDTIVMQEQSMFLSQAPFVYKQTSVPWAKELYNMFKNSTERVCLFETWAYKNGNPSFLTGLDDNYNKMQSRLFSGYNYTLDILRSMRNITKGDPDVKLSPVGEAWSIAQADPRFKGLLWQQDGMHPKPHGTYLAACVFYSVLFQESPVNNRYKPKGVNRKEALALQRIAQSIRK
jgi:hypothetical protein